MPYSLRPPSLLFASKMVTSCPSMASRCAQDRPAGPPPTTATRLPREGIAPFLHQVIDGVPLEHADMDWLVLRGVADALVLAQDLGRADPRAHAAEDVGFENLLRRTLRVAGVDHADEVGNVDRGGTGLDT